MPAPTSPDVLRLRLCVLRDPRPGDAAAHLAAAAAPLPVQPHPQQQQQPLPPPGKKDDGIAVEFSV